ncbi:MAG: RNA polymerase sigma factor [Bacteroidota bacterium]
MTQQEFQHTVTPIQDKLYRFALRMMNSSVEAEDVVQEVLIKLWQQREKLCQITNIEAWSIRLTRNASIDKIRTRKTTEPTDILLNVANDQPSPEDLTRRTETFDWVKKAIADLPEKQRAVMHLRDIEEYSYQEIAEALGIPLNQVKVNLSRARKQVRQYLLNLKLREIKNQKK